MVLMLDSKVAEPRGILNPELAEQKFQISRHLPTPDLSFFVERYWIIQWDLQQPYVQETLPYPCVNLVFEKGDSRIWGVVTGKFARQLNGKGGVFGIKFRPGAFYPFLNASVSSINDTSLPACEVFGEKVERLEPVILSETNKDKMIALAENFLRERLPACDENIEVINEVVDYIIAHREITLVDEVVQRLNLNKRTLQRLFSQYVGVSPKWVIKRYRLHEAAERLAERGVEDWARLAVELGYFDQAHFIKDFKAIVGYTPTEYMKHIAHP
jgi:AraC-like DNA-binding protein